MDEALLEIAKYLGVIGGSCFILWKWIIPLVFKKFKELEELKAKHTHEAITDLKGAVNSLRTQIFSLNASLGDVQEKIGLAVGKIDGNAQAGQSVLHALKSFTSSTDRRFGLVEKQVDILDAELKKVKVTTDKLEKCELVELKKDLFILKRKP